MKANFLLISLSIIGIVYSFMLKNEYEKAKLKASKLFIETKKGRLIIRTESGLMQSLRTSIASHDPSYFINNDKMKLSGDTKITNTSIRTSFFPNKIVHGWERTLRDWEEKRYSECPVLYTAYCIRQRRTKKYSDFALNFKWLEKDMDIRGLMFRRQGEKSEILKIDDFGKSWGTSAEKKAHWSTPYKFGACFFLRVQNEVSLKPAFSLRGTKVLREAKAEASVYWGGGQLPLSATKKNVFEIAIYDEKGNVSNWLPIVFLTHKKDEIEFQNGSRQTKPLTRAKDFVEK